MSLHCRGRGVRRASFRSWRLSRHIRGRRLMGDQLAADPYYEEECCDNDGKLGTTLGPRFELCASNAFAVAAWVWGALAGRG